MYYFSVYSDCNHSESRCPVLMDCMISRMSAKTNKYDSILYTIQKTFAEMSLSNSLSYYPSDLIVALGIDPHVQCDVHEFFDMLMPTIKSVLMEEHQEPMIV